MCVLIFIDILPFCKSPAEFPDVLIFVYFSSKVYGGRVICGMTMNNMGTHSKRFKNIIHFTNLKYSIIPAPNWPENRWKPEGNILILTSRWPDFTYIYI